MSDSMKHVSQENLGGPEVLQITATNRPEPGVGEILIRVRAAGINPVDTMIREAGLFAGQPPFTLGYDVSGTVEVAGPGVTIYQPGDDVFGMLPFPNGLGAYAEYVVGPARAFVPKPSSLDHISAAALPLAGLTAWQAMVETAEVKEGNRVLINGATGGVGHLAVQIVKNRGAHVIAMASTDNVEFAHSLGADEIIDYTRTDFTEKVDDLDVMLEVIGDDYPSRALEVLKPGGILVSTLPHTVFEITESAKQRQVRVAGLALLVVAGRQAAGLEDYTTFDAVREECRELDVYDQPNFAAEMTKLGLRTRGNGKRREARASRHDFERAADLIRRIRRTEP